MSTKTIPILVSGAVAALLTYDVGAQSHPEKPTYKYEKCYGVAKAGMNDCFFSGNSCAGTRAPTFTRRATRCEPCASASTNPSSHAREPAERGSTTMHAVAPLSRAARRMACTARARPGSP